MINRRTFLKTGALAGVTIVTSGKLAATSFQHSAKDGKRVGIIGLDTSHSTAFTKLLNTDESQEYGGYKVVAAYPYGSRDIESSVKRIPEYIEEVKKHGVRITNSIKELLEQTDVILLETNDGRLHLEQALEVFEAGKTVFIDKPVAASLADAISIYEAAEKNKITMFSASSLRYMSNMEDVLTNKSIGKILGADTYSPCALEKTHPDLFWYGIHGVEALYTVMGTGCKTVSRIHTPGTDIVNGVWEDNRIGTFRGVRVGSVGYGGFAFGEKGVKSLGDYNGYAPLLKDIIRMFQTGSVPVTPKETLEIFTFMEAAHESTRRGGAAVELLEVWQKAKDEAKS